jgi:hypothetical protein
VLMDLCRLYRPRASSLEFIGRFPGMKFDEDNCLAEKFLSVRSTSSRGTSPALRQSPFIPKELKFLILTRLERNTNTSVCIYP